MAGKRSIEWPGRRCRKGYRVTVMATWLDMNVMMRPQCYKEDVVIRFRPIPSFRTFAVVTRCTCFWADAWYILWPVFIKVERQNLMKHNFSHCGRCCKVRHGSHNRERCTRATPQELNGAKKLIKQTVETKRYFESDENIGKACQQNI